jgi:O-antigen ligase
MIGENASRVQFDSKDALVRIESHRLASGRNGIWLLLWSLFLGGVNIHLAGRQPVVLYFDAVLVIYLIYEMFWNGFFPNFSGWVMRLGAFCILSGTLSSLVNYHDINKSLASLKVLICGLLVYAMARKAAPSILTLSLWGAAAAVLLLTNYQTVRYDEYEGEAGLKDVIGVVLGRSNYVASILLLLIPLGVAAIFLHKGKIRLLFAACTMLMFGGLIATMSRGAMLAIVLATMLSLPLLYKAGLRVKHAMLVLALGGAAVILLPSDLLSANAALIVYRLENPDEGRPELMTASWESFKQNPLLGVGPGQLGNAIASHMQVPDFDQQYTNAHNLVLNALAENGLPAGLALLAMVGIVLYRAVRTAVLHPAALNVALCVSLLAAVIHNMVEASFEGQQFQVVFWTVAGIVEMRQGSLPVATQPST